MRGLFYLVVCSSFALLGFAAGAPSASAGDCHDGHNQGRVTCNRSGTCHVRDRCHPSTRYVIPATNRGFRNYGCGPRYSRPRYGGFSELRAGLRVINGPETAEAEVFLADSLANGAGYAFLGDWVLTLNESNPQVAARMASVFNDWRRYDEARQGQMQTQLERIASGPSLSKDVYEIVNRALSR